METSESIRPDSADARVDVENRDLGKLLRYENRGTEVLLFCETGNVAVTVPDEGIVRVTLFNENEPQLETTVAVSKNVQRATLTVTEDSEAVVIAGGSLRVRATRSPLRVTVQGEDGTVVAEDVSLFQTYQGKSLALIGSSKSTAFYGLGEKTSHLNKQGESTTMWNSDVYAPHVPEIEALYVSIPFLIQFRDSSASGLFLDNPGRSFFDMRKRSDAYEVRTDTGGLDMYFISGSTIKDVLRRYTELTGRITMPPKWAIGYQQSRYSYMSQQEVLELARTFREKKIPLDAIYLDIHYMDGYRVFTFNRERFPDPKAMMDELREMGVRIVPIVDPGVKQDPRYPMYREGVENDYFCKSIEGDIFIGEVWPGASAFPDFTEDEVGRWWADRHQYYLDLGVGGIWNDMNEPAVFNEIKTMEPHIMHRNNGNPKTHEELHNLYGMLMSRATYQGLLERMNGERPFVLTRAAYSGIQRYAAVWTGDNRSFWEHMAMAMPMVLNMGLSGVPFAGPDVGGFAHHTSGELLARWTQMGAFFPFFRNHSALDVVRQEPWSFGEEIEEILKRYINLRYQLMPYIYSVFRETSKTGLPIIRPLVLEYPDDKNTVNLCDEFLLGEDLLVAPVYRPGMNCRMVYLPQGTWINYWTGEKTEGGQHVIVDAPLEIMPIFVRAGAVIPEGPLHQHAGDPGERAPLVLHVYAGGETSEGCFTLYDDDGHSLRYQEGRFNETQFTVRESESEVRVEIRPVHCGFEGSSKTAMLRLHRGDHTTEDKEIDLAQTTAVLFNK